MNFFCHFLMTWRIKQIQIINHIFELRQQNKEPIQYIFLIRLKVTVFLCPFLTYSFFLKMMHQLSYFWKLFLISKNKNEYFVDTYLFIYLLFCLFELVPQLDIENNFLKFNINDSWIAFYHLIKHRYIIKRWRLSKLK